MQRALTVSGSVGLALGLCQCHSTSTVREADVVVSVKDQKLGYYQGGKLVQSYKISTSKFGVGDRPGSCQTPLGRHEVIAKIGHGLPTGAVLKSRQWNGEVLKPNAPGRDPVVSRIMWLSGLESDNHNALKRYIYIHGTTEENLLGKPASYGCVRMSMSDVVNLFNEVNIGARVVITKDKLPVGDQMAVAEAKSAPKPLPAAPPASSNPPIPVDMPVKVPGEIHSEYAPGQAIAPKALTGVPTSAGKQKLSLPVEQPAVAKTKDKHPKEEAAPSVASSKKKKGKDKEEPVVAAADEQSGKASTPKKGRMFGMFKRTAADAETPAQPAPEVTAAPAKEKDHAKSKASSKKDKPAKEESETAHVNSGKHKPAKTENKTDKKKTTLTLKTPKGDAASGASKKHKADVAAVKA